VLESNVIYNYLSFKEEVPMSTNFAELSL